MTKNWLWALVAGVTMGTVFGACGDTGEESLACSADTDCLEGEVCIVGTCVVTCESGADCPSSAKTCGDFARADGTTAKVCQCSTDELCNSEGLTGLVCQPFALCTARCDEGFTCPTGFACGAEGKCEESTCETNADCATGETCNTDTGACEATAACDPAATTIGDNGGISTCSYGEECNAGTCEAVVQGSCTHASNAPAWSSADTTRPVITNITAVGSMTSDGDNECGGGGPKTEFTVEFYSPTPLFSSGTYATWRPQVQQRVGTSTMFGPPAFEVTMVPVGANVGQFSFGVCGRSSGSGAVYVSLPGAPAQTSNAACVTW